HRGGGRARPVPRSAALLCVLLLWAAGAGAQGGGDEEVPGSLFLRGPGGSFEPALGLGTQVDIRVSGLVARVRVRQRFQNQAEEWLDGSYLFPLPEMAAVDRMVLRVGDRRIEGRIQEREEAKRTFEAARKEGRSTSLLEQQRPNLFAMSLANIGPGETVDVEIEYQQSVHYERGGFELRFPMTFTSRYVPGRAGSEAPGDGGEGASAVGAGGDPARVAPRWLDGPAAADASVTLRAEIDAGLAVERIESPSHEIRTLALEEGVQEVWLDAVPAERDFVLRWAPKPGRAPRVAAFSEERDGDHYLLLMVLPPELDAKSAGLPRETVFVIDTSGSMSGVSIKQARAALQVALDHLEYGDSFNVIAFDQSPRALFPASEPVTRARLREAHAFVGRLQASGGTEMLPALQLALRDRAGNEGLLRQVIFITDASIANEMEIFSAIEAELGDSRLFMVGIGSAPNTFLLNRAASLGRGSATMIADISEVQERTQDFFRKIENPVLSDIEVHWNDEVEMWPARVPDLYAGEPVVITAKLRRFVGDVRVMGVRGDRPFEARHRLSPGISERGIHKLWARRKIAHWMGERASGVHASVIRDEVLSVALHHQLVSRFTSLVAVDATPRRPIGTRGSRAGGPNTSPASFKAQFRIGVLPAGSTHAPFAIWVGIALLFVAAGLWRLGVAR
ncbi:MAG: marine proteobacterial sortase target protein, partial [Myxococcota bacterium]